MPKKKAELSALAVKRLSKKGRHAVGGVSGLLLCITSPEAKSWVYRVTVNGRRRSIGLGGYPDVSLARAREMARVLAAQIAAGVDPLAEKEKIKARPDVPTFSEAARRFYESKRTEFSNIKHSQGWLSSLEIHAFPVIGRLPVDAITLQHILKILEPIWQDKTETASRVRQRIEAVLSWATVSGYRKGENPARWKGHLDAVLPAPGKIKKVRHYPALHWKEIGEFMLDLKKVQGQGARALELLILTACRSGEVRQAVWGEFNFAENVWTVPPERMKARKAHTVPLSRQAIELLRGLHQFEENGDFVFPSTKAGKSISDMTLSAVCRRMGVGAVPHGFRSTFRDWCAECTGYPREVAEMALAHTIESKVEAAYRRGDLIDKRRGLMQEWADFIDRPYQAGKVIEIRRAAVGSPS